MGIEIKLTDKELPVSPAMIEFLDRWIEGRPVEATWSDQLNEALIPAEPERRFQYAQSVAEKVMEHPVGRRAIYRAYELLAAISVGALTTLRPIQERYRFICIVGCPRHGGSYLTKEVFAALGRDASRVPNAIAHDGFPDLVPFRLDDGYNSSTAMTQQIAEYLAMVEVFFEGSRAERGRIVVPKKATKAAYHGAFFKAVLGPDTEYIITLRHPVAACISTYEKSTGLPSDGRFQARGNIEEWARRDVRWLGMDDERIAASDYFDVYLRYWENYHYSLALTGLFTGSKVTTVAYGKERLQDLARKFRARFHGSAEPDEFKVFDKRARHPAWSARADEAIARVAQVWGSVGVSFPADEIAQGW